MGYSIKNWDGNAVPQPESAGKKWSELATEEQEAGEVLGFTGVIWDNESGSEARPASYVKSWSELTGAEKAAGLTLGHNEQSWDGVWVRQPASDKKYWADLTEQEMSSAVRLGYSAQTWDNDSGSETQPASAYKVWSELSSEEVAAATDLGYTDHSWDNGIFPLPASAHKKWAELTSCGRGEDTYYINHLYLLQKRWFCHRIIACMCVCTSFSNYTNKLMNCASQVAIMNRRPQQSWGIPKPHGITCPVKNRSPPPPTSHGAN